MTLACFSQAECLLICMSSGAEFLSSSALVSAACMWCF